ncbi:hypothetical protein BDP27DRAFT_1451856 [Rhodocollybia butyracea]|uniref:DUF6534 domain-containing protein n=1 Tax=Rhodocollybia butyracea TaxID=206335 RepID=A0A9P5PHH8_9AGAR|nr:hypothetical protein BDP27DRAFT_1451856 [Rhodocollybia butyracea]
MANHSNSMLPEVITHPVSAATFEQIFGAALVMVIVTCILYGIVTLQAYFYHLYYKGDSKWIKAMVWELMFLDTVHTVFLIQTIYLYVIKSYGDPTVVVGGSWQFFASVAVNTAISAIVQLFFAWQIIKLTKQKWKLPLSILLVVLILVHFAFGVVSIAIEVRKWQFMYFYQVVPMGPLPRAVVRILSDSAITVALCILLKENRSNFSKTNTVINTLIIYAVNRLLLCTFAAFIQVVAFAVSTTNIWAILLDFMTGELYVNALLGTLNSRHYFHADTHLIQYGTNGLTGFTETTTITNSTRSTYPRPVNIQVDLEQHITTDGNGEEIEMTYSPQCFEKAEAQVDQV